MFLLNSLATVSVSKETIYVLLEIKPTFHHLNKNSPGFNLTWYSPGVHQSAILISNCKLLIQTWEMCSLFNGAACMDPMVTICDPHPCIVVTGPPPLPLTWLLTTSCSCPVSHLHIVFYTLHPIWYALHSMSCACLNCTSPAWLLLHPLLGICLLLPCTVVYCSINYTL